MIQVAILSLPHINNHGCSKWRLGSQSNPLENEFPGGCCFSSMYENHMNYHLEHKQSTTAKSWLSGARVVAFASQQRESLFP